MRHRRRRALSCDELLFQTGADPPKVDLDAAAWNQKRAHLYRGAWRRRREELLPYLVEVEEVIEVGEEYLRLHHVLEVAAGGLEHAAEIVQNVARLLLDVGAVVGEGRILPRFGRHAGLVVRGDLPRCVQRLAGEEALAVVRHRRGRGFAADHFTLHENSSISVQLGIIL